MIPCSSILFGGGIFFPIERVTVITVFYNSVKFKLSKVICQVRLAKWSNNTSPFRKVNIQTLCASVLLNLIGDVEYLIVHYVRII